MSDLILKDIVKRFGATQVVHGVNLTIPAGKLVCFLGPSGCGKTTLLRMIAGLDMPSSGHLLLGGEDLTCVPANQREFGMVFQSLALFPHLSVGDNIGYPLKLRGVTKEERQRRVAELLELIQLPQMVNRTVAQLSGGQRQRVAIARAIAYSPKLLLLDEPLSALDAKLREAMQVEIRLLQQRLGITTIMVTHDQREAMTMADVIVVMEAGRIAQVGSPLEIYRNPVSEFVADFIGLGNILAIEQHSEHAVRLPGGQAIRIDTPRRAASSAELKLLIRPEDVCLKAPGSAADNAVAGTVSFIRDVGSALEATIDCSGFSITCATTPREAPDLKVGAAVLAELPSHACKLIAARSPH
jgi:putative spermidine/putrescine transport system ATP-binding protein